MSYGNSRNRAINMDLLDLMAKQRSTIGKIVGVSLIKLMGRKEEIYGNTRCENRQTFIWFAEGKDYGIFS